MLKKNFAIGTIAFASLLVIVISGAIFAVSTIRIGGEAYHSIIRDKDLIADILPPPAYVIEANLEASQAMLHPEQVQDRSQALARLHDQYNTRVAFWSASALPDDLKSMLSEEVDPPAQRFWNSVEAELLPALQRGDGASANAAFARVQAAYAEHRRGVDQAVVKATELQAADEAKSQTTGLWANIGLAGGAAGLIVALASGVFVMSRRVFSPVATLSSIVQRLADGEIHLDIPGQQRKDEIGVMARAIDTLRSTTSERADVSNDNVALMTAAKRNQAVIEFDMDGKILDANDNFLTAVGYSLSEIVGRHHRIFVEPDYAASAEYQDFWRKLSNGQFVADQFVRVGRNGQKIFLDAAYNPILGLDGKPYKVVKFARDVTATETARRDYQKQVDDVAAVMVAAKRNQAVIEMDIEGKILDANDNFLKVMGYSLGEIVGQHHRLFVDRDYAASSDYAEFWRKLGAGQFVADKFARVAKDGQRVILMATYSPIVGPDGKPYKVVKFASDITAAEEMTAEAERRRANAAAEQADVVKATGAGLSALSSGNLSFRITEEFSGEYAQLKLDFNAAMASLEETMGVITSNAQAMQTGAGEISQAADDLSRRTEQQAATLEETAAALDEITATVRRTAEGAQRATVVVTDARQDAEASGLVVSKAVSAMGEIERSADQISQIIGVIDEIAFQTNLLALNAGVEAARAGDAGRGFAVVASEVRALAQRSAEAAKEIKALISASTGQVKEGVTLVGQTGQALGAIVGRVSEINNLMAEINASAQEQATALGQVNTAVNQMDQTTQQNAAMVEQSTAASHNLSQEASELAHLVGKFSVSTGASQKPRDRKPENAVRAAQARIADFAGHAAGARRTVTAGSSALAESWEEF